MVIKQLDNIKIISPLEIKHYVLDIPIIKPQYQENAVKFALRALYPGNDENTTIDYAYVGKKVIGIATKTEKLMQQSTNIKYLLSPTLIAYNLTKNGIVISISHDWVELLFIKEQTLYNIFTFSPSQSELLNTQLMKLCDDNPELPIFIYQFNSESLLLSNIHTTLQEKKKQIYAINIYKKLSYSLIKKSKLFCKKRNNKKSISFFIISSIAFLSFAFIDFIYFKKSLIEKQNLVTIRNEYNEYKRNLFNSENESISDALPIIPDVISIDDLLYEISICSNTIRLLSFSINENSFRFEAEKANALKVLEILNNSILLEDVILYQSIPQDDGTEKFIISGRIKNE